MAPPEHEAKKHVPAAEPGMANAKLRGVFRLQPDERLAFFRGFLRHPQAVASIVPSSRFLERRLARLTHANQARVLVELGPGTGGTTRAMLAAMPPDATLLAIEINPRFVALLKAHRDPRLIVHHGSAEHLRAALAAHGLAQANAVLSGIPFSTMPARLGRRILQEVWESLAGGGCFVAYQFRGRVATLARDIMGKPEAAIEPLNVPPVRIYRWTKPTT